MEGLTNSQKEFCKEYIYDWNATRAYKVAYPTIKNDNAAGAAANQLLRNIKIQRYLESIQKDLEKLAGISRMQVLDEFRKIAFSSIAHLHNTWIERKEFEKLTEDQKACIQEISTQITSKNIGTRKDPEIVSVEYVKIKLHDKQKALESVAKMLGYNEAEKHELIIGKPLKIGFSDNDD